MHHVFVYGTLKRGFIYHPVAMATYTFLGRYRTCEPYPLVIAGRWFSPVLINAPGEGRRVLGEVYEVDDEGLAALDRLEGTHVPRGYSRIDTPVEAVEDGARCEAWIYVKERTHIDVIHSDPLEEYRPDPRYVPGWARET